MSELRPIKFLPNRARRVYRGGLLLDKWQGNPDPGDSFTPEEWIASLVPAVNHGMPYVPNEGLSVDRASGRTLKNIISEDPVAMLGARHYKKFGATMGILVKALDSMERLPIQVHPDKALAKRLLGSDFGKTEAWYILDVRSQEAAVYAGFKKGVTLELWQSLFEKQDIPGMVDCLVKIPAKPGDVFLIRGGLPHAIGAGCLLMEIQEPTDITVRLERKMALSGVELPDMSIHSGIGFDHMFECFSFDDKRSPVLTPKIIEDEEDFSVKSLISYDNTTSFAMEEIDVRNKFRLGADGVFCLLVVLSGNGVLDTGEEKIPLSQSEYIFLPAQRADSVITTTAGIRLLRCLPPQ